MPPRPWGWRSRRPRGGVVTCTLGAGCGTTGPSSAGLLPTRAPTQSGGGSKRRCRSGERSSPRYLKAAFLGTHAASSMLSWADDVGLVILGARRAADALVVLDQVLRGQGSFPVIVTKDS